LNQRLADYGQVLPAHFKIKSMKISKSVFYLAFLVSSSLFIFSCHEWEQEIILPDTRITNSKRVVLIEEFTGASCVNCPAGIAATKAIQDIYPDNVVVLGVHSNFLAQPATKGQVDLRNPDAQAIEAFLGFWLAKPEAAFNRLYDDLNQSFRYGTPDSWKTFVDNELKKDPQVELLISRQYDETTRLLKVNLTVKAVIAINEAIHLHCGITESEIIADQLDNFNKLENYVHNHVLRKMITPIPGVKIADAVDAGQVITKEFSFTLPQDSILWKAEHCDVFAFVSLNENKKYVLQAAETKVK
jgi:hypothetical protein